MMLVKHNLLHFTASHMHAARTFFHNAIVHWLLIGTFFLNIALWCFVAYFIRPGKIPIILHYNVYFGVDLVGAWWHAYAHRIIYSASGDASVTDERAHCVREHYSYQLLTGIARLMVRGK